MSGDWSSDVCSYDLTDPYLISTAWQLAWLKAMTIYDKVSSNNNNKNQYITPDKYYKLDTNIFCEPGLNWIPIGESSTSFSSNFDGGNNLIYGMNIDSKSEGHFGFFSDTENANISNLSIKGTVSMTGGTYMGGFSGTSLNSTFSNCNNYVKITSSSDYGGGIIGVATGNMIIENCTNNAEISMALYSGGIIGCYELSTTDADNEITTAKIDNCTNNSDVSGTQEGVGGIIGSCQLTVPVEYCTNNGAISRVGSIKDTYVGGIVGNGWAEKIFNCANNGDITGPDGFTGYILGARYESSTDTNLGLHNTNTGTNNTGDRKSVV